MAEQSKEGKEGGEIEIKNSTNKVVYAVKMPENFDRMMSKAEVFFDTNGRFPVDASLRKSAGKPTDDQALWAAIRDRTNAIGFERYFEFINRVLCLSTDGGRATCPPFPCSDFSTTEEGGFLDTANNYGSPSVAARRDELDNRPGIYGVDAYQLLKLATQAFLLFESGVVIEGMRNPGSGRFFVPDPNTGLLRGRICTDEVAGEQARRNSPEPVNFGDIQEELEKYLATNVGNVSGRALPYLKRIVSALPSLNSNSAEGPPYCNKILRHRFTCPSLLELIWSYWHEEGMLVQTMNAISLRFQNKRRHAQDPLANLTLDPLRPLTNIVWGFIQDENNRLSLQRRAYEYDNQYGITLVGKAVPRLESADSRSQFIKAFHNLLYRTAMFYREDDDATITADAFSLLNALREVHIILAEGAHNQFGDLPWTARHEMLTMQWMLARPEMREFLRGRFSVPYQETWMGPVDDMKRLQGWTDVTITHFRELGVYGEQIVLSIRYGDWIDVNDQEQARNWARDWRPEIQRYMHAYFAVSGVDLTAETVDARSAEARYAQPSLLLQKRLAAQQPKNSFTGGSTRRLANTKGAGNASLASKVPNRLRIDRDD